MTLVIAGCCVALLGASSAYAGKAIDRLFPADGVSGGLGGQFNQPRGIDVRESTGQFYVVDSSNHRIQRFSADGTFQLAWGVDVVDGVANPGAAGDTGTGAAAGFEICTVASECKAGLASAGNSADNLRNGAMSTPQGVAINQTTGDVYVRDRNNRRVNQYTAAGTFIRSWGWNVDATLAVTTFEVCPAVNRCQIGSAGAGDGQFGSGTSSRYDGTGIVLHPTSGDVFVVDPGAAANRRVHRFQPDGDFISSFGSVGPSNGQAAPGQFGTTSSVSGVQPNHVAVDASGVVYVSDLHQYDSLDANSRNRVQRYDTASSSWLEPINVAGLTGTGGASSTNGMQVDNSTGHLLVSRGSEGIVEIDLSGAAPQHVDTHLTNSGLTPQGLGVNSATGELFVSSASGGHRVYVLDDDGPGVANATVHPPSGVGSHTAHFTGSVNPEGFPSAYRFEYSKNGVTWTPVGAEQSVGSGNDPVEVEADVTGLEANTLYQVRIFVRRDFGAGTSTSSELTFRTDAAAPELSSVSISGRGATNAFVAALINPNNLPTTYRVEYGITPAYGQTVPVPSASAGSGGSAISIGQEIPGLTPGGLYYFRLLATNSEGTTASPGGTFTTRSASGGLPGRAYELVSPPYKVGGMGVGTWYQGPAAASTAGWASPTTERFAVQGHWGSQLSDGAFAFTNDVVFAERTGSGWAHRPAMTLPGQGSSHTAKTFSLAASAKDFSLTEWQYDGGRISLFPETGSWPDNVGTQYVRDWDGRWELLAPTDDSQYSTALSLVDARAGASVISDDGRFAVVDGASRGVLGPDDPTHLDFPDLQLGARTIYLGDVSGGLANGLPGNTARALVNVCTGEGAARTEVPTRDGSGKLVAAECPPALPGRSARLISTRGASLGPDSAPSTGIRDGLITADGARVFFMSPDPVKAPAACGTATGESTSCPAQLYVRQRNQDGGVVTRWISRSKVTQANGSASEQDASLLDRAIFEGATPDGDKVFFRTRSPLTADDPNGIKDGAGNVVSPPAGGVTTGTASSSSDDLYMYDLPDGPDGDPATADGDPADGELIRISGGPAGVADCDVVPFTSTSAALRFFAEDGSRAYFTCSAVLDGAAAPSSGTITTPGGSPGDVASANIYLYDASLSPGNRWKFMARLPRLEASEDTRTHRDFSDCATTGGERDYLIIASDGKRGPDTQRGTNCWNGSADGAFVTFFTDGRLTEDDPDATTGDLYAYDADSDELSRISAPQGGSGGSYDCVTHDAAEVLAAPLQCNADNGFGASATTLPLPRLGVVAVPPAPGDRIAYFQSMNPLVANDHDDGYDVYRWRNGELSLVTSGASGSDDAMLMGTDRTGLNVYFATRQQLSWQDVDAVLDIYTARVGGGIPQPPVPVACEVLAGGCHSGGAVPAPVQTETMSSPGPAAVGNASPGARTRVMLGKPSRRARRRAARRGVLALRVRTTTPGRVRVVARGRLGRRKARRLGATSRIVRKAGTTRLRLRLNRPARRRLARGRAIRIRLRVAQKGARGRSMTVRLARGARS